jgi:hypothetical protein
MASSCDIFQKYVTFFFTKFNDLRTKNKSPLNFSRFSSKLLVSSRTWSLINFNLKWLNINYEETN